MRVESETGDERNGSEAGDNLFGAGEQESRNKNRGKVKKQS